jgi:DNA-binding TFAR19-related protein (PDSD5 family)
MLRRVALVRTDVSEELSALFIRVTRIGELETTLAVTSSRRTLQRIKNNKIKEALSSSETHHITIAHLSNNCFVIVNPLRLISS